MTQAGRRISRRDVIRRGAVLGGSVLWATPVIQSLSPAAYAQMGQSPGTCAACYCWNGTADKTGVTKDQCADDGTVGFQLNRDECQRWCAHEGPFTGVAGAPGGPFQHSEYCSGANACRCSGANDGDPTLTGVDCS